MKDLSDAQAAYIAGIIDGEGSISVFQYIRKNRPSLTYKVRVVIVNTDKRVIDWVKETTGIGWIVSFRINQRGDGVSLVMMI